MILPPALADLRKRPGMILPVETYDAVLSFVLGYDAAMLGGLLAGFREWLVVKVGAGNNLTWPGLVHELWSQTKGTAPSSSVEPDEAAAFLFDTIEEFLRDREQHDGARRIYAAHERWLRQQDWYGPSWPGWISDT